MEKMLSALKNFVNESAPSPVILVVDDEPGFRDLLSYELGARNYRVLTCANGGEAVRCIRENSVDVVVSDIMMPVMDGIEMLGTIKTFAPETEVILITGNASIESAIESMKRGAYDYLTKPYQVDDLARIIGRAVDKKALSRHVGQLEELSRLKSELIRQVNLEVRSPLDAILAYSTLFLDGVYGQLSAEQREAIEHIHSGAKSLLKLINAARIE